LGNGGEVRRGEKAGTETSYNNGREKKLDRCKPRRERGPQTGDGKRRVGYDADIKTRGENPDREQGIDTSD